MAIHPVFSIVVPVYNSERSLKQLYQRLVVVFRKELKSPYEIIFVDDASTDHSWNVLKELKQTRSGPIIIQLSRNFGQHSATLCGFNYCRGDYVVTLDDDLQHPPEEIPKLFSRLTESGADVVIGRPESKKHSLFRNIGSAIIDRTYQKIFDKPPGLYIGTFRILRSWVVKEIAHNSSPNPIIGGLILQTSSRIINEKINHCKRVYGNTNYTISRLMTLTKDLFFNYSVIPLMIVSRCGFFIFGISIIAGIYILVRKIYGLITVPGWASIMLLLLFFSGLNMIVLGVVGEYLAKIIKEVTRTKQYLIRGKMD
jgi:glycosyltransferase involved in cell wall biosynthesis